MELVAENSQFDGENFTFDGISKLNFRVLKFLGVEPTDKTNAHVIIPDAPGLDVEF